MSEEIRQIEPEDEEIQEEWIREAEPGRTASANRVDEIGGWQVAAARIGASDDAGVTASDGFGVVEDLADTSRDWLRVRGA